MKNTLKTIGIICGSIVLAQCGNANESSFAINDNASCKKVESKTIAMASLGDLVPSKNVFRPTKKDITYTINRNTKERITKTKMLQATTIQDLLTEFPYNWVEQYQFVGLSWATNDFVTTEKSTSPELTDKQFALLEKAQPNDKLFIQIIYLSENAAVQKLDSHEMNIHVLIVPEKEASYEGGIEGLNDYFVENTSDEIANILADKLDKLLQAKVPDARVFAYEFEIGTTGKVEKVTINKSSGSKKVDTYLKNMLLNMPAWEAAENEKQQATNQVFELHLGLFGC